MNAISYLINRANLSKVTFVHSKSALPEYQRISDEIISNHTEEMADLIKQIQE